MFAGMIFRKEPFFHGQVQNISKEIFIYEKSSTDEIY